jgi:hypothetical protein
VTYSALEEAEIIPGKHSDTRIKPLDLTNGYGHYITVTPERALASVGGMPVKCIAVKFLAVSIPKPPCNGRLTSETTARRFQKRNRHLDPEVV